MSSHSQKYLYKNVLICSFVIHEPNGEPEEILLAIDNNLTFLNRDYLYTFKEVINSQWCSDTIATACELFQNHFFFWADPSDVKDLSLQFSLDEISIILHNEIR